MKKPLLLSIIIIKGFGELLFLYGLLGWMYGVLIQLFYPEWLTISLSHLTPWIRVDTFTIIAFIISAVGFLIWRLTREFLSRFS
jgi:asparagine N-glycosylation enzyme membrane subunit Stt3